MVDAPASAALLGAAGGAATARPRTTGHSGTIVRSGVILDPDEAAEFKGEAWYGTPTTLGAAQRMHRDPYVRQAHDSHVTPIRRAVLGMDPGAPDELSREAARFAERWTYSGVFSWDDFVRQSCLDARDGVRLFEVTDDVVEISQAEFPLHPGRGRAIVFTGFHDRPAWTIRRWIPKADNSAELAAVEQHPIPGASSGARIEADRLLRFTYDQEAGGFQGLSLWRSAAAAWKVKRTLIILDAIRHERQGLGVPTMTAPEDATEEDFEKAEEMLASLNAQEKGFMVLPNGFKFEWSSGGESTNMAEAISYCDRAIAFVFGGGFLLLGGPGGGPGSYALSSTLSGQHELTVEVRAFQRLERLARGSDGWSPLRRLIDLNYGAAAATPRPVLRNLPTRDWAKILPQVIEAAKVGLIRIDDTLRAFIRSVMLLPAEDAGAAPLELPAAVTP